MIAAEHGSRHRTGHVGAAAWFAEQLAPDILAGQNAQQELLLLPRGLAYWEGLAQVISEEPALDRDRMMLGMLQPLGIEKDKPFNPDARQKEILLEAVQVGEVMARTIGFDKRFVGVKVWPGKHWEISLFLKETSQEAPNSTLSLTNARRGSMRRSASQLG